MAGFKSLKKIFARDTVGQFFSGFSSSWSEWSSCSKTCGDGEKTRQRGCTKFCPDPFELSETKSCNKGDCKLFPKILIKFTVLH